MTGLSIASEVSAAIGEAASDVGAGQPLVGAILRQADEDQSTYPPTPGEVVAYPVKVLQVQFGYADRMSMNIENGDVMFMVEAQQVEPLTTDKIRVQGVSYAIESVMTTNYGGVSLYHKVQGRGGVADSSTYVQGVDVIETDAFAAFFVQYTQPAHSLSVLADTRTGIAIEPSVVISTAYAPFDTHDWFEGGRFRPYPGDAGSMYELTFEIDVTATVADEVLAFDLDIGDGTSIPIKPRTVAIEADAGMTQKITVPFDIYAAETFIANGALLQVKGGAAFTIGAIEVKVDVERIA